MLYSADVPIGQPFFLIYRYSPWSAVRGLHAVPAAVVGLIGIFVLSRGRRESGRVAGWAMLVAGVTYGFLVLWTFFAPPNYVAQHSFNMLSPSHEGAFVMEGRNVASVRDYVTRDFFERLKLSPEQMAGRRVLSNPPGMTVASIVVERFVEQSGWLRAALVDWFGLSELDDAAQRASFASALAFAILLTLLWGASLPAAYRCCRLWLSPRPSMVVAFACAFNPATVSFSPGKDSAQALTGLLIVTTWMAAYVRKRKLLGFASGVVLAAATMIGLIHVWVFLTVSAATLWDAARSRGASFWMTRCALPSLLGATVAMAVARVALGWNIPLTVYRVAQRYGEIQLPIITDPLCWTLLGLPMFLLFVGATPWGLSGDGAISRADPTSKLGRRLMVCLILVMTYTYFFGNNSETPRLWIPFIPILILSLALTRRSCREDHPAFRRMMTILLCLQLLFTLAHWSLMDVRESEYRLSTGRMWN